MRAIKMIFLIGSFTVVMSGSIRAVPLDITFTGGTPEFDFGYSAYFDPGFLDYVPVVNKAQTSSINLAGVNSITMTWSAPAGYMYVVNPPPPGLQNNSDALYFETDYGSPGQASSLGSITSSSLSVHTVFGTSPLKGEVLLDQIESPALYFGAIGEMSPSSASFAFTSLSISADFSSTGANTMLEMTANDPQSEFFAALTADFPIGENGLPIIPSGIGPFLTLEPLPSGSAPEASSTLVLAGLGFGGLLLVGRKRLPVNC